MNKKITLISILGESSGVVTEALEFLEKKGYEEICNIVLYTKENRVLEELKILKKCLKKIEKERLKAKLETKYYKLPIEDIKSEKDMEKFKKFMENFIKKHAKGNVIFNISGGRKIIVILALEELRKHFKNLRWINIISYLSREEISEMGEIIREKIDANLMPEKTEIEKYFFSDGNYKVFEFTI